MPPTRPEIPDIIAIISKTTQQDRISADAETIVLAPGQAVIFYATGEKKYLSQQAYVKMIEQLDTDPNVEIAAVLDENTYSLLLQSVRLEKSLGMTPGMEPLTITLSTPSPNEKITYIIIFERSKSQTLKQAKKTFI